MHGCVYGGVECTSASSSDPGTHGAWELQRGNGIRRKKGRGLGIESTVFVF
jgi:hypothetical protein